MPNIFKEIEKGNAAGVKKILSVNPNVVLVVEPADEKTPLHVAAHLGHAEIVEMLLSNEAKFEAQDKHGNTPLHLACDSTDVESVQALLGAGKKVTLRTKNKDGQTPLHIAVANGDVTVVKELMLAGARPEARDKAGFTVFDLVPQGQDELARVLSLDYGLLNQRTSPVRSTTRQMLSSKSSKRSLSSRYGSLPSDKSDGSPDRSIQQSQTPPSRRTEGNAQVPRKQMIQQEQAIQALKSELQDLGGRMDTIQEYLHEKKEAIDCSEKVYLQVESHDRQLAELDQRLAFQESHLRDLRPQVGHLGDESRLNREQYQHMKQMVDMWRESVRSSLERVLERVKEWETVSAKWNAENNAQVPTNGNGSAVQPEDLQKIEAQITSAHHFIAQLQSSSTSSLHSNAKLEKEIEEVKSKLQDLESTVTTRSQVGEGDKAQVTAIPEDYALEMDEKIGRLQSQLTKTASRSERVEELFDEQMRLELSRKAEQERELSQREARILDFRQAALEEEQQRQDLLTAQENQRNQIVSMEKKIDRLVAKSQEGNSNTGTKQKVKDLEARIQDLEIQIAENAKPVPPSGKCCVIS